MEKTVYNRTDTMKAVCRNACICNKRIYCLEDEYAA